MTVSGRMVRTLSLRSEGWEFVDAPESMLSALRNSPSTKADIFSFVDRIDAKPQPLPYHWEPDPIAAMEVDSYEKWFNEQITSKTRNMVRKAATKGVAVRVVPFTDDFVRGIQGIQDESPVRQGMPFWHYKKDFETTKAGHATFLDRSHFIGAYLKDELIGYIKMVDNGNWMGLMQILSKVGHRDKAPNNALIAKAVEVCAAHRCRFLSYGIWSTRSLGDFKIHHGLSRFDLRRYLVPLTLRGRIALKLRMHRSPRNYIPQSLRDWLAEVRAKHVAPKLAGRAN